MVFSNVLSIDADGEPFNLMTYGDWGLLDLMCFNIVGQAGVFMRRSDVVKVGMLDLSYRFMLDHHLWLRIAQLGKPVYIPETWASARMHAKAKNVALARGFGEESYHCCLDAVPPGWLPDIRSSTPHWGGQSNDGTLFNGGRDLSACGNFRRFMHFHHCCKSLAAIGYAGRQSCSLMLITTQNIWNPKTESSQDMNPHQANDE